MKVDCWCPLFGTCLVVVGVVYLLVNAVVSRCLSVSLVAAPRSGGGISAFAGKTTLSAHVAQYSACVPLVELNAAISSDEACRTPFTFRSHAFSAAGRAFGGLAREKAAPTPACCLSGILASGEVELMDAAAMAAAAACRPMCLCCNMDAAIHSQPHDAARVCWLVSERFCSGMMTVISRWRPPLAGKSAAMKHGIVWLAVFSRSALLRCFCASFTKDPRCASLTRNAGIPLRGIIMRGAFAVVVSRRITMSAPFSELWVGLWRDCCLAWCRVVLCCGSCTMGSALLSAVPALSGVVVGSGVCPGVVVVGVLTCVAIGCEIVSFGCACLLCG